MGEFFKQPGFGSQVKELASKTSKQFQGQKGDQFYLDARHRNHIEVFDMTGKEVRAVLNLDGSYNDAKTKAARAEGRRLPK
ncbi:hypothetical protein J5224_26080 [Candidatus Symbiopectobacterium sp. NZEC135]|nr:hypothetical protein [Candidatus Symbiopectobacterium sp. NZEC135]